MRTVDVVAATGYSAQQVRDLERLGVIPPAHRATNGYRQFSHIHVNRLRAYRDLAAAVGPIDARAAMRVLPTLPRAEAAALLSSFHTRLAAERDEALAARAALVAISDEATREAAPVVGDSMTITELAHALGVRTSALRFWESVGLVAPDRIGTGPTAARHYRLAAIREARITAALRAAGYRVPEVRVALTSLREMHDVGDALVALDIRLERIATRSIGLLRAGAALAEVIELR